MDESNYRVGRGKPPLHSRFRKGESGNPGGRPGAEKTVKAKLRDGVLAALEQSMRALDASSPNTCLQSIARNLVLSSGRGKTNATKFLLALLEEPAKAAVVPQEPALIGEQARASADPAAEGRSENETLSLTEGKTQGRFASAPSVADENGREQGLE